MVKLLACRAGGPGSIPGLDATISEIGYLLLPSRDMAEISLNRRKSSKQPITNQSYRSKVKVAMDKCRNSTVNMMESECIKGDDPLYVNHDLDPSWFPRPGANVEQQGDILRCLLLIWFLWRSTECVKRNGSRKWN